MMQDRRLPEALSVFAGDDLVGTLYRDEPLAFGYSPEWLVRPDAMPLHPALPLAGERYATPHVHAFFENLLPEGDQRRLISLRYQVSSVFGLLATIGGDTAGSYVLLPQGQTPQAPVYQRLSWEQVDILIHADSTHANEREEIERAAAGMPAQRVSISGAQLKLLLNVDRDGVPWRPMGTSPSSHILKPDMARPDIRVFASAANESVVMRAAQLCDLPTARTSYQPQVKACLVERYDRQAQSDGRLRRLWQADFCQIAGKPSNIKYEYDGGPTFRDCYETLGQSAQPGVDRLALLRWLFFNLYVGNNDTHAKNLSLFATGKGLRLAPFYDLMCTRVYTGLGPHFAFTVGGESEPGKIGATHVRALAKSIGANPKYVFRQAADMARRVDAAIVAAAGEIMPMLGPSDVTLVERVVKKIRHLTQTTSARILSD